MMNRLWNFVKRVFCCGNASKYEDDIDFFFGKPKTTKPSALNQVEAKDPRLMDLESFSELDSFPGNAYPMAKPGETRECIVDYTGVPFFKQFDMELMDKLVRLHFLQYRESEWFEENRDKLETPWQVEQRLNGVVDDDDDVEPSEVLEAESQRIETPREIKRSVKSVVRKLVRQIHATLNEEVLDLRLNCGDSPSMDELIETRSLDRSTGGRAVGRGGAPQRRCQSCPA